MRNMTWSMMRREFLIVIVRLWFFFFFLTLCPNGRILNYKFFLSTIFSFKRISGAAASLGFGQSRSQQRAPAQVGGAIDGALLTKRA